MGDQDRRNQPLLPMRIVTQLTELTPRQIRYYEKQGLIQPDRTDGKHRLFSFTEVDRLLAIKAWKEKGINLAGIKEILSQEQNYIEAKKVKKRELSDRELHQIWKRDRMHGDRPSKLPLNYGDFSGFFHH